MLTYLLVVRRLQLSRSEVFWNYPYILVISCSSAIRAYAHHWNLSNIKEVTTTWRFDIFSQKNVEFISDVRMWWLITVTLQWFRAPNWSHRNLESIGCLDMCFGKHTIMCTGWYLQNLSWVSLCLRTGCGCTQFVNHWHDEWLWGGVLSQNMKSGY